MHACRAYAVGTSEAWLAAVIDSGAMLTLTAGSATGEPAHVARVALRGGGIGSNPAADDSPLQPGVQHTLSLFFSPNGTTYAGVHTAHADHEDEESGLQVSVSPRELVSHKLAVACGVVAAATRQGSDGFITYTVAGARVQLEAQGAMGAAAPQAGTRDDAFVVVSELRADNVDMQEHLAGVTAAERQEAELRAVRLSRRRLSQITLPCKPL